MDLQPVLMPCPGAAFGPVEPRPGLRRGEARIGALLGRVPPAGLILLSIVSVQLGSAFATVLFADLGPGGTTLATTGFATLMLALMSRPRLDRRLRRHAGLIVLFGIALVAMLLPFFLALQTIPLGIASTVAFLGPLALAVAASRRPAHFLWCGVAVLGLLLLTPEIGTDLDPWGLGLAALAALGWAAFVPLSKRAGQVFDSGSGLTLGMAVATLLLLPYALMEGTILAATALQVGAATLVALLATVFPMALEFAALQRMPARTYGILLTLEPAAAAVVGAIFLGQGLGGRMLLAIACVTVAALGVTVFEKRGAR